MFGDPRGLCSLENFFVKAVDDEAAFLFAFNESRVAENTQVMRDCDDFQFQTVSQFAHVHRTDSQRVNDFDAGRVAERTQLFGTMIRLKRVRLQDFGGHAVTVAKISEDVVPHEMSGD